MSAYERACIEDFFAFLKVCANVGDYSGTMVYNISTSTGDIVIKSIRLDHDKPVIVWDEYPPDGDITVDVSCTFDTFYGLYTATLDPTNAVLTGKVAVKSWRYRQLSTIMSKFDFSTPAWDQYYINKGGRPDFSHLYKEFLEQQNGPKDPFEIYDQECNQFQSDIAHLTPKNIPHVVQLMGLSSQHLKKMAKQVIEETRTGLLEHTTNNNENNNVTSSSPTTLSEQEKLDFASQYLLQHIQHEQHLQNQKHPLLQLMDYLDQIPQQYHQLFTKQFETVSTNLSNVLELLKPVVNDIINFSPQNLSEQLTHSIQSNMIEPLTTTATTTTTTPPQSLNISKTDTIPPTQINQTNSTSQPIQLVDNSLITDQSLLQDPSSSSLPPSSSVLLSTIRYQVGKIVQTLAPIEALRSFSATDQCFYLHSHVSWQYHHYIKRNKTNITLSENFTPTSTEDTKLLLTPTTSLFHYPPEVYYDEDEFLRLRRLEEDKLAEEKALAAQQQHQTHNNIPSNNNHPDNNISNDVHTPLTNLAITDNDNNDPSQHNNNHQPDQHSPQSSSSPHQLFPKPNSKLFGVPVSIANKIADSYVPIDTTNPTSNLELLKSRLREQAQRFFPASWFSTPSHTQQLALAHQLVTTEPIHPTLDHNTLTNNTKNPPTMNNDTNTRPDDDDDDTDDDDAAFNQSVRDLVDILAHNEALLRQHREICVAAHSPKKASSPLQTTKSPQQPSPLLLPLDALDVFGGVNFKLNNSTTDEQTSADKLSELDNIRLDIIRFQQHLINFTNGIKDDANILQSDLFSEYNFLRGAITEDFQHNLNKMKLLTKYFQYKLAVYQYALQQNVEQDIVTHVPTHHSSHRTPTNALPGAIGTPQNYPNLTDPTSINYLHHYNQQDGSHQHNVNDNKDQHQDDSVNNTHQNHSDNCTHDNDDNAGDGDNNKQTTPDELLYHNVAALYLTVKHLQIYRHTHHYFLHEALLQSKLKKDGDRMNDSSTEPNELDQDKTSARPVVLDEFVDNLHVFSSPLPSFPSQPKVPSPITTAQSIKFTITGAQQQQQQQLNEKSSINQPESPFDLINAPVISSVVHPNDLITSSPVPPSSSTSSPSFLRPINIETQSEALPVQVNDTTPPHPFIPHPYDLYMYTPNIHLDEIVCGGTTTTPTMESALYAAYKALKHNYLNDHVDENEIGLSSVSNQLFPVPLFSLDTDDEEEITTISQQPPSSSSFEKGPHSTKLTSSHQTNNPLDEVQYYLQLGYPLDSAVVFVATSLVQNNIKLSLEPEAFVLHPQLEKDTIDFYTKEGIDAAISEQSKKEHRLLQLQHEQRLYDSFMDKWDFPKFSLDCDNHLDDNNDGGVSIINNDLKHCSDDNHANTLQDILGNNSHDENDAKLVTQTDADTTTEYEYFRQYFDPNQEIGFNPFISLQYSKHLYSKLCPPDLHPFVPTEIKNNYNTPTLLSLDPQALALYRFYNKDNSFLWYHLYPMMKRYNQSMKTFLFNPLGEYCLDKLSQLGNSVTQHFHPYQNKVIHDDISQKYRPILDQAIHNKLSSSSSSTTPSMPQSKSNAQITLSPHEEKAIRDISIQSLNTPINNMVEKFYQNILINRYNSVYTNEIDQNLSPSFTPSNTSVQSEPMAHHTYNHLHTDKNNNGSYFLPFPSYQIDPIDNLADLWLSHATTHYEHVVIPREGDNNNSPSTPSTEENNSPHFIKHKENPLSLVQLYFDRIQTVKREQIDKHRNNYIKEKYNRDFNQHNTQNISFAHHSHTTDIFPSFSTTSATTPSQSGGNNNFTRQSTFVMNNTFNSATSQGGLINHYNDHTTLHSVVANSLTMAENLLALPQHAMNMNYLANTNKADSDGSSWGSWLTSWFVSEKQPTAQNNYIRSEDVIRTENDSILATPQKKKQSHATIPATPSKKRRPRDAPHHFTKQYRRPLVGNECLSNQEYYANAHLGATLHNQ